MRAADLDWVVATEEEIYPFPWTRGNFADALVAGYEAWVFECAGERVGYAIVMWLPDEVHLLNLSIAAARQRQGLGRDALDWLLASCGSRGARAMLLEVRPSNEPARRLYDARGFVRIGLRRGYYPSYFGTREDAIVMRRDIAHG